MTTSTAPDSFPGSADPELFRIEVLACTRDLERIAPEWKRLWNAIPGITPFQSPEWLLPWWKTVGQGELFTIAIWDREGLLQGLFPGYIYTQPADGERHLLLLGAGTSDYLDGLFAPCGVAVDAADQPAAISESEEGLRATAVALDFLANADRAWNRAFFHQLRPASPLLHHARRRGWTVSRAESCSMIPAEGLTGLPARLRANIRRYRRRAQDCGSLQFHVAGTLDEAMLALEQLITLHTRRWRTRGEGGVLSVEAVRAHHRMAVPALFETGMLRMFSLRLDGATIAVLYAIVDGSERATRSKVLHCYLIGFDPELAELSPGTLLLASVFEYCVAEGFVCLDLLRGGEAYKRLWGAVEQPTFGFELPRKL